MKNADELARLKAHNVALREVIAAMEREQTLAAAAIRAALDDADAPRDPLGPGMGEGWWDGAARRIREFGRKLRIARGL
jgi:hypothetical protein